ncbi:MAG: RDD family protein [Leptolyngbya sp. DLM2.Bin15]|nr:MAG: RDD family protein [Leptolyngbya sp. DLM2.Bin15]
MLISYSLGTGVGVVLLPLWQAIKAVLYYDLTERREGRSLDLDVSDRPSTPSIQQWLNHVTLLTPESVELDFTLAGVGNRSWALVLDYIFLIGGLFLFWLGWGWMSTALLDWIEDLGFAYDSAWIWVLAIAFLITFIIFTGYFVLFETLWQGQTPGKRIMHLRVIQDNGQPVTLGQTTLRSLLRPVDDLLLIGALLIALGKREKRLGDWVAGTQVIQEDYADPRLKLEISPSARTLARNLSPSMNLDRLSPAQFVTLREYLQRRLLIDTQIQKELRLNLARQAKVLVQLEQVPEGVSADQFLEALYVAYQGNAR